MKPIVILLVLLCQFRTLSMKSQISFEKTFGRLNEHEQGVSGIQTSDDGYIFCGSISSGASSSVFIVKTDSLGDTLWTKNHDLGFDVNNAVRIHLTSDSCYILAGTGYNNWQNNTADYLLLKVNQNGDFIWSKNFTGWGMSNDYASDLKQTKDKGYIISGRNSQGVWDYPYLVKTDSLGIQQWNFLNFSISQFIPISVVETLDGYFTVLGDQYNGSISRIRLLKIDPASGGQYQWSKQIAITGLGEKTSQIIQNPDSSYTLLTTLNNGNSDMCIVKCNSDGDTLWSKIILPGKICSIDTTTDGGFVISGTINQHSIIAKLDTNYDTLWTRTFPLISGYSTSLSCEVHQTKDKGFILIGTLLASSGFYDAFLIKTDSLGNIVNMTTGINNLIDQKRISVFPNPANDNLTITLSNESKVKVKLLDLKGLMIKELVVTGPNINLDLHEIKNGTYILQLYDTLDRESLINSQKIIIQR